MVCIYFFMYQKVYVTQDVQYLNPSKVSQFKRKWFLHRKVDDIFASTTDNDLANSKHLKQFFLTSSTTTFYMKKIIDIY